MTFDSSKLSNVKSYDGKLQVQTIDGEELLITTIGKVSHQLPLQNVSFISYHYKMFPFPWFIY